MAFLPAPEFLVVRLEASLISLARQSGFRETLSNPLYILFILERLPGEMFAEGVLWIDLFKFTPDATGLVNLPKMTKSGNEDGARKICPRHEQDALP